MSNDRKKDFDYFGYFCKCADFVCQAADYLNECITNFEYASVFERVTLCIRLKMRLTLQSMK